MLRDWGTPIRFPRCRASEILLRRAAYPGRTRARERFRRTLRRSARTCSRICARSLPPREPRPNLGTLDPHGQADHVLGRGSRGGKDRAQIREHVRALRRHVFRNFSSARVCPGYAARRQNISDARNRGNRIGVAQSLNFKRFPFAHGRAIPQRANSVVGQTGPWKKVSLKFGSLETSALL